MAAPIRNLTCQNRFQFISFLSINHSIFLICTLVNLTNGNFYSHFVMDGQGREISLEVFRGKPALVVNVASECGYTQNHYEDLVWASQQPGIDEELHILAFPCNQFGQQEPKGAEEIIAFARETYGATFPIFGKIDVIGEYADPAFKYLSASSGREPDWNFWKYLIDRQGRVIDAWGPTTQVSEIYDFLLAATQTPRLVRRDEF
ncbi:glutathione peroxidase 7-like [Asterias rubens]|uniref:glutathione peroxidase 7-like n=1 Tax=Asterias rubens TaxID=7604 RepID=UPI001455DAD4|nr:glutathione peroxidase 7-like [Asterias rubens]